MSKPNNLLVGGIMHTAGIYSDMTVDGPDIGTLVIVVDRAKNLPNRKTIGKQDPYCAARLGKEAKKTETDRRGGQTPRWDQEMRFTVHDSPDYYQLKVSVFNDDKKTDLIGETYINLAEVVVPGGGKNDLWHQLNFKQKYAGEIRIEITYYDSRPKAAKSLDKKRQAAAKEVPDGTRDPMSGPRQQKVKRRPLPNNPTTALPSPARPAVAGGSHQTQAPSRGRVHLAPEPTFDNSPSHAPTRGRALPAPEPVTDFTQPPLRNRPSQQEYQPNQSPLQRVEYNTPSRHPQPSTNRHTLYDTSDYCSPHGKLAIAPAATSLPANEIYDIYDPAPPGSEYIPGNVLGRHDSSTNDGDQQMTVHTQPDQSHYTHPAPDEYSPPPSPDGPPPPPPVHGGSRRSPLPLPTPRGVSDPWDMPNFANSANAVVRDDPYDPSRHVKHAHSMPGYAHAKSYEAYSPPKEHYRPQSRDQRPLSRDGRPPSRDQRPLSRDQQNSFRNQSYDDPRDQRPQSRDQQTSFRHHSYDNPRDQRPQSRDQYDTTPRHHSYDDRYRGGFESMQATVEDAPPSPGPGALTHSRSGGFSGGFDDRRRYDHVPSPAPLNLGGRGSAASGRQSASTQSSYQMSNGYSSTGSPASFMDRTQNSSLSSHRSGTKMSQQYQQSPRRRDSEDRIGGYTGGQNVPAVPSSLVAGMDPTIAQEISERIYNDKRDKRGSFSNAGTFPRNGYYPEPVQASYQQTRPTSSYGHQDMSVFVPASTPNSYSQQSVAQSNGTIRERSPAPMGSQHAIMRKSVSPAPAIRDRSRSPAPPRERRLSGIPFGPDDYDALNPTLSRRKSGISFSGATEATRPTNSDEKIITHDGREIDPSDYFPEHTYAAEYEKKTAPKPAQAPLQTAASIALARPRSQGRPYSMGPTPNAGAYMMVTPNKNPSPGRTRLQKKSARNNAPNPVPITSSVGPLAPITYQDNNNFTPNALVRSSTNEYDSNENYAPSNVATNYGSHQGYRGGSAPPIPAKIPMPMPMPTNGNGGMGTDYYPRSHGRPPPQANPENAAWNLLEEMKSIDLGTGSSRARHGRKW